jgi:hypothetical protein
VAGSRATGEHRGQRERERENCLVQFHIFNVFKAFAWLKVVG